MANTQPTVVPGINVTPDAINGFKDQLKKRITIDSIIGKLATASKEPNSLLTLDERDKPDSKKLIEKRFKDLGDISKGIVSYGLGLLGFTEDEIQKNYGNLHLDLDTLRQHIAPIFKKLYQEVYKKFTSEDKAEVGVAMLDDFIMANYAL